MAYVKVCDECGSPAKFSIYGMTGRVLINGEDNGQSVDLCEYHKPTEDYPHQANNCKRVVLFWGDGKGGNMYPPRSNEGVGEFLPPSVYATSREAIMAEIKLESDLEKETES